MKRPLNQLRRRQARRKAAFWSWIVILLFLGQNSFAQGSSSSVTADVTGTVLTEKGELLQGATVVARNTATNITSYSVTDDNGVFLFRRLAVGSKYDFSFSFLGYEPGNSKALWLSRPVRK